jgi:hypothetical protein
MAGLNGLRQRGFLKYRSTMQRPALARWNIAAAICFSQLSGARCHVDARFRGRLAFRRHASLPKVFCQKSDLGVHGRKVGCTNQRKAMAGNGDQPGVAEPLVGALREVLDAWIGKPQ